MRKKMRHPGNLNKAIEVAEIALYSLYVKLYVASWVLDSIGILI